MKWRKQDSLEWVLKTKASLKIDGRFKSQYERGHGQGREWGCCQLVMVKEEERETTMVN